MMNRYASSLASPLLDTDTHLLVVDPEVPTRWSNMLTTIDLAENIKCTAKSNGNMNEKFKKEDTAQKTLEYSVPARCEGVAIGPPSPGGH
ncbi:hypothetical protein FQR65_LT14698 [Abscondita terminalis]|nr:hypothetical protein FQR65_LT14698 [Abscondita terminalis]